MKFILSLSNCNLLLVTLIVYRGEIHVKDGLNPNDLLLYTDIISQ